MWNAEMQQAQTERPYPTAGSQLSGQLSGMADMVPQTSTPPSINSLAQEITSRLWASVDSTTSVLARSRGAQPSPPSENAKQPGEPSIIDYQRSAKSALAILEGNIQELASLFC